MPPPPPASSSRAPPTCRASTRLAQVNRATRNNVFGLLLPQAVIPSISGPVLGTNNLGTAWGSAIGALVTWEPFDFGLRRANVAAAEASRAQSEAALEAHRVRSRRRHRRRLPHPGRRAGDGARRAGRRGPRTRPCRAPSTRSVNAELRPGADASRAEAELAAARTQLIQARAGGRCRARHRRAIHRRRARPDRDLPRRALLQLPPEHDRPPLDAAANPDRRWSRTPPSNRRRRSSALWSAPTSRASTCRAPAYARGTGAETNGNILGGVNGLAPNVQNYALGFSVTFPDLRSAGAPRARSRAVRHHPRADGPRRSRSRPTCGRNGTARSPLCTARAASPPTRPCR